MFKGTLKRRMLMYGQKTMRLCYQKCKLDDTLGCEQAGLQIK